MTTNQNTRFSTVREVADVLRVSRMTVYRLIHDDIIPAYTVGRSVRIPTSAVWEYLEHHRVVPTSTFMQVRYAQAIDTMMHTPYPPALEA